MLNITHQQGNKNQNYSGISPHQSEWLVKNKKQVSERIRRKGNPLALLVGMKTDVATLENSLEVPQKAKNRTPYNPTIAFLGT